MAKIKGKYKYELDDSLLEIGVLCQMAVDVMNNLCKRFGAEKANCVYDTAMSILWHYSNQDLSLEIITECGIELSPKDLVFLAKIAEAERNIRNAKKFILEALNEEEN
jgi:hypothetical protein